MNVELETLMKKQQKIEYKNTEEKKLNVKTLMKITVKHLK